MTETEKILKAHASRYPLMLPQDVVKLLYQSEFGTGHLITNRDSCLKRLYDEYNDTPSDETQELYENIGNSFFRLNLAAARREGIGVQEISDKFISASENVSADINRFINKLNAVKNSDVISAFSFSIAEFDEYLQKYISDGCHCISHSAQYRKLYQPAYRVVRM